MCYLYNDWRLLLRLIIYRSTSLNFITRSQINSLPPLGRVHMLLPESFQHCEISLGSSHLMFHCFVLVETNYYRCTGGCQCMVYAPAHLQAILLPRSIFSSNLHCSAYGKVTIQNYFLYSSKQKYFSLPIHQLPENRP